MGSEAMPIGLSRSSDQARPNRPTFWLVTCSSGLKCCELKSPPLTSQFAPVEASARTRCASTLPALFGAAPSAAAATMASTSKRMPVAMKDLYMGAPVAQVRLSPCIILQGGGVAAIGTGGSVLDRWIDKGGHSEPPNASEQAMKVIRSYSTSVEADVAKIALDAAGVPSTVVGVGVAMEGGASGVQLLVPDEYVEAALEALERS